ncbi:hypothetical protein RNZ50_16565 [Paracoccaceae bacterium Fryx2]|nr:hypothetical protein [Paracoccaceae bacterium Fryx2]
MRDSFDQRPATGTVAEFSRGRPVLRVPPTAPDFILPRPGPATPDLTDERPQPIAGRQIGGTALILGNDEKLAAAMRGWIKDIGAHAVVQSEATLPAGWLERNAGGFDFCVVDADFLGDEARTLDLCLRLKNASRQLPVILVDGGLGATDTTAEAMNLCDGRLAADVTAAQFAEVVQGAMIRVALRETGRDTPAEYRLDLRSALAEVGLGVPASSGPAAPVQAAPVLTVHQAEDRSLMRGWWILPVAASGVLAWTGIIALVVSLI